MYDAAIGYNLSANQLSQQSDPRFGSSITLLSILAFEVLLKAVYLLDNRRVAKFGHKYTMGFAELSQPTKDFVIEQGQDRYAGHVDFEKIDIYLEAWSCAFTKGRYAYEILSEETDKEAARRGIVWEERGGQ